MVLQFVSIKLFTIATSSAALEHNFLNMGVVHTKLRNRLNYETFEKLAYVRSNSIPAIEEYKEYVVCSRITSRKPKK